MNIKSFHDDGVQSVVITESTLEEGRQAAARILANAHYSERVMDGGSLVYTVTARKERADAGTR